MPTGFLVTAQATLGLVKVAWTAVVATTPVTHYQLQISSHSDFTDSTTTTFQIKGTTGRVTIPGAKYSKDYWAQVAAVSAEYMSDFAQENMSYGWSNPVKST